MAPMPSAMDWADSFLVTRQTTAFSLSRHQSRSEPGSPSARRAPARRSMPPRAPCSGIRAPCRFWLGTCRARSSDQRQRASGPRRNAGRGWRRECRHRLRVTPRTSCRASAFTVPNSSITDCGLKSYLMSSSTALSLSSLEYMLASKPPWFGSAFRQRPQMSILA